jgi:hypothetical protein
MAVGELQTALGRIFFQRCSYLFTSILALIAIAPYLVDTERGRVMLPIMQMLVLVADPADAPSGPAAASNPRDTG